MTTELLDKLRKRWREGRTQVAPFINVSAAEWAGIEKLLRALPSSPDEKSAQEICGRCGQPRSERCGNDFIPMSAENLAKREAAQAATAVNTAEGDARALSVLDDMLAEMEGWEDPALADAVRAAKKHFTKRLASPPASASMSAGVTAETLRAMRADALQILDAKDTTLNPTMCRVTMEQLFDRAMYSAERARVNTRAGDARCAHCGCALAGHVICRECTDLDRLERTAGDAKGAGS